MSKAIVHDVRRMVSIHNSVKLLIVSTAAVVIIDGLHLWTAVSLGELHVLINSRMIPRIIHIFLMNSELLLDITKVTSRIWIYCIIN